MRIVAIIVLLLISVFLFILVKKKWLDDRTLQNLANIAVIVTLFAAALVFVIPEPYLNTSTSTISSIPILEYTPSETPILTYPTFPYGGGTGVLSLLSNNELILFNSNDGKRQKLMDSVVEYSWSPDGSKIAVDINYGSLPRGLYIIDMTDQSHKLIDDRSNINRVKWSPDGNIVSYIVPHINSYLFQKDIVLYNLKTNQQLILQTIEDFTGMGNELGIQISTLDYAFTLDQSNIYFSAVYGSKSSSYIYRIRESQWYKFPNRVTKIISGSVDNLKWAPNGTKMSFVNCEEGNIYLYDPYNPDLFKVTNFSSNTGSNACIMTLAWMKDSRGIIFSRGSIYLINNDGTNLKELTVNAGKYFSPSISPDGKLIAYSNGQDIYLMDINGLNVVRLTEGESVAWQPVIH